MTSQSIKSYINNSFIFILGDDMRDTCDELYRKQYTQLRNIFIPLYLDLHDRFFNILRIITLLYHLYNKHEIYDMSLNKKRNCLYDNLFIKGKISVWDDFIIFDERFGKMGY